MSYFRGVAQPLLLRSKNDAVDGSSTDIQVPHCACYSDTVNVRYWHLADILTCAV